MKKNLIFAMLFIVNSIVLVCPAYAQTSLLDSVKVAVMNHFNAQYSSKYRPFTTNDLDRRYEIIDILTRQRAKEIKNGMIYHCARFGDDVFGAYVMLENNKPVLLEINNTLQAERARLFMRRNNYTPEQIDRGFDYILLIYIREQQSLHYYEFNESKDYREYLKEAGYE